MGTKEVRGKMMDMDAIYREYADPVFKYLMTLCRDEDTAQESGGSLCREIRWKMQSFHLAVSDRETSLVSGTGEAQAERHQ